MNGQRFLIVGLGAFGVQVKRALVTRWDQIQRYQQRTGTPSKLTALSVGIERDKTPDDSHVILNPDTRQALNSLREPLPPSISGWFDSIIPTSSGEPLTRPQARLAWTADLRQGELSMVGRLWQQQFHPLIGTEGVTVFLFADTAESFASAVMLDAVYLTRWEADFNRIPLTLWAFTRLPSVNADHHTRLNAFAALSEAVRLTLFNESDVGYGAPFPYSLDARPGKSENGKLRGKPFDLWHVFEADESADAVAMFASAFLYPQTMSEAGSFTVNVRMTDADRAFVRTGRVQAAVLPVQDYRRFAVAETLKEVIAWLSERETKQEIITGEIVAFFALTPYRRSETLRDVAALERHASLLAQERQLDHWLLGDHGTVPAAFAADALAQRALLSGSEFSSQNQLVKLNALIQQMMPPRTAARLMPYQKLLEDAGSMHIQSFNDALVEYCSVKLNDRSGAGGLNTLERILSTVQQSLAAAHAALTQIDLACQASPDNRSRMQQVLIHVTELHSAGVPLRQRIQHAHEVRIAEKEAFEVVQHWLTGIRLRALASIGLKVIQAQLASVSDYLSRFAQWKRALRTYADSTALPSNILPSQPHLRWVAESLKDSWLHAVGRAVNRLASPSDWSQVIQWKITHQDVMLIVNGQPLSWQSLDVLQTAIASWYDALDQRATVLGYLNEHHLSPPLVETLKHAEQLPLNMEANARLTVRGRLYVPESHYANERKFVQQILQDLNETHRRSLDNRSQIDLIGHAEADRLLYAFWADGVDLRFDSATYHALADYSARHSAALSNAHVFSADRERYRLEMRTPPLTVPLRVSNFLYDIERLGWFWQLYGLGQFQINSEHNGFVIWFEPTNHRPARLTLLKVDRTNAWIEAVRSFLAGVETVDNESVNITSIHPLLSHRDQLSQFVSDSMDTAGSGIQLLELSRSQPIWESWYQRAVDTTTPAVNRVQIETAIRRDALYKRFFETLTQHVRPFLEDDHPDSVVLRTLFLIGINLLEDQRAAIANEMTELMIWLPNRLNSRR